MEVHLTAEQEEQLSQLAAQTGKPVEQVAQEAISRMLDEDARFRNAVRKGFASLDRGEYLTHEEVDQRIERLFQS